MCGIFECDDEMNVIFARMNVISGRMNHHYGKMNDHDGKMNDHYDKNDNHFGKMYICFGTIAFKRSFFTKITSVKIQPLSNFRKLPMINRTGFFQ